MRANMKRCVLRNLTLYTSNLLKSPNPGPSLTPLAAPSRPRLRFYSSENDLSGENPSAATDTSLASPQNKETSVAVEDVGNKGKT